MCENVKVFNPYRTMIRKGEWVEGFKADSVHDALTAREPPKGPPLILSPLTSSAAVSPARIYRSPDAGLDFVPPEAASSSSLPESWARYAQCGYSWKMFQGFYPRTGETISASSPTPFRGSGMAWRGEYLTVDTSESPSGGVASTLSEVLEASVARRFSLSQRAAAGILRRAERRGKALPPLLEAALRALVATATTSTMKPMSANPAAEAENLDFSRCLTFEQPTEMAKVDSESRSSVRRLTPTECERLQAFPDGWTHDLSRCDLPRRGVTDGGFSMTAPPMPSIPAVPRRISLALWQSLRDRMEPRAFRAMMRDPAARTALATRRSEML